MSESDQLLGSAAPVVDGDGEAWNKGMYLHSVNAIPRTPSPPAELPASKLPPGMRQRGTPNGYDDEASVFQKIRNRMLQIKPKDTAPHKENFHKQSAYESLDYELTESEVELEERRKYSRVQDKWKSTQRWLLMFLIGFFTALIAFTIDTCIQMLSKMKFAYVGASIRQCVNTGCLASSFVMWAGFNLLFVGIATSLVAMSPVAAGSGIPEVKCYLNGIKMPGVVRIKTLAAKCIGVMFSVSGGLFVGKEGPMIHSGAVVAAGISQGKSTTLPWLDFRVFSRFRNDTEKRDFVSAGAAAGVSAAFGAPIGGVLFSLEEGCSFWNQSLTWRIFFASMTATFTLNILLSNADPNDESNELSNPGLLNFGQFTNMPYSAYELPVFMFLGVLGGLLGALFNFLNEKLTVFRMKYITSVKMRAAEAMVICLLTVSMAFVLMLTSSDCLPLGDEPDNNAIQLFCEDHQYSAMGSLLFNTAEDSIKNLFHNERGNFEVGTLLLFSVVYFFVSCVTYGVAVPSGLFVPCILTGAAWGRMIGTLFSLQYPDMAWSEPGKYALIGSAAMLGGVVRMTISLTVIIIEATGNITYGLPIMITVVFAKWVGDYFNEGLYDIHIELKHIPLLAWDPPTKAKHFLTADDLMSRQVVCLHRVINVGQLYYMLSTIRHQAFPIIEFEQQRAKGDGQTLGTLNGIILRHQLLMILKNRAYGDRIHDTVRCRRMDFNEFMTDYPRFSDLDDFEVPVEDFDKFIDLAPYLNPTPYVVSQESTLARIFRLFRTMGLRHLMVVNKYNEVVGMITRKDLTNVKDHHTRRYLRRNQADADLIRYILPDEFNGDMVDTVGPSEINSPT